VIAFAALTLEGAAAGLVTCAALAVLAFSRACASVSYKDVLGKTVGKTRRGTVTGVAGSVSSSAVILFAILLMTGLLQDVTPLALAIGVAALMWLLAALIFSRLEEEASEPAKTHKLDLSPLKTDPQFRQFIYTRGALTATALAPP
jgi:hypothetical protein